jgi:hypothetical protein
MSIPRSVAEVLREHVVLEVEAIDRMYLNVYVPHLQSVGAVVGYLRVHRGQRFASTTTVTPMTEAFVRNIDQFIKHESVDLVAFQKWQRKDDVTLAAARVRMDRPSSAELHASVRPVSQIRKLFRFENPRQRIVPVGRAIDAARGRRRGD